LHSHVIALDELGGLQTLFVSFAAQMARRNEPLRVFNRARGGLESYVQEALADARVDVLSPSSGALAAAGKLGVRRDAKLAKALNLLLLKRALSRSTGDPIVLWNIPPSTQLTPRGSKVVVYDHGMSSLRRPERMLRESLAEADGLIAISRANEWILRERWDWRGPIQVITNPLRDPVAAASVAPKTLGATVRLGCASRLISKKGIASAVHAVKVLRDRGQNTELRIAGDGPETDALKTAAERLGIGDHVTLLGKQHDMPAFFNSVDIVIAPSLREPFGLTPLEALAMGVPTILSAIDGHPEVLPFELSATLIEPTYTIDRYVKELGATGADIPEFVYSPKAGRMTVTRALDPVDIADAVDKIVGDYPAAVQTAGKASEIIRKRNSIDAYADRVLEAIRA
jgi:glycosyltransferase involved in cell wall biosynthesis